MYDLKDIIKHSSTRENKTYLLIFFINYIYTCKVENLNLASFVNTNAYACHLLWPHVKETHFSTNVSGQRGYMHILLVSRTSKDLPDTDQHDPDRILICSCNQFTSWNNVFKNKCWVWTLFHEPTIDVVDLKNFINCGLGPRKIP